MAENKDDLVRIFLQEQKRDVPDNGFSKNVMSRLPKRSRIVIETRVWTAICILAAVLFLFSDAGQSLLTSTLNSKIVSLRNVNTFELLKHVLMCWVAVNFLLVTYIYDKFNSKRVCDNL